MYIADEPLTGEVLPRRAFRVVTSITCNEPVTSDIAPDLFSMMEHPGWIDDPKWARHRDSLRDITRQIRNRNVLIDMTARTDTT